MSASSSSDAMAIDWAEIEDWDRRFYLHNVQASAEYQPRNVAWQEGNYLFMADGSRLLDFASQLASANLGHRHPAVVTAVKEAMQRYGQVYFAFGNDYRARVAKLIVRDVLGAEGWAARLRIFSSGTNAMDAALSMARQATGRELVLTQRHSFHGMHHFTGTTLRGYRGQLSSPVQEGDVADVPGYPPPGFIIVPEPGSEKDSSGRLRSIGATRDVIEDVGAEKIAAIVTEPMLTAAGAMGDPDYMRQVRDLADTYGFLWIDDEVICGFGRLGEWFGYQLAGGAAPDLMVIGKGMNSCILPVGGLVVSRPVGDYFENTRWFNGSTWDGHPIVCASVIANVETMLEEELVARAKVAGHRLRKGVEELAETYRTIVGIDGAGLCLALNLASSDPRLQGKDFDFTGDLSKAPGKLVAQAAAERGVFLSGFLPTMIRLAPPLTVTESEIEQGLAALEAGLIELERRGDS
jgi:taurine--2-oxoglutarate transaminase